jgi:hypothetical protein
MASMLHTYVRIAPQPCSVPDCVSGERPSGGTASPEDRVRPTDTQVWNWVESAALSGYGPSAASFL